MATNSRHPGSHRATSDLQSCSVTQLVSDLLDTHKSNLDRHAIRIETDMQPIEATISPDLIRKALSGLILNAIDSTPPGGEIAITSIDGIHQWEIEVADSSHVGRNGNFAELNIGEEFDGLDFPVLVPFPRSDNLRDAYRAAFKHEGQIQCWECPQGGMAYVLVIPRRRIAKKAA